MKQKLPVNPISTQSNIVFLGISGFPGKTAALNRIYFLAESLKSLGIIPTVINNKAIYSRENNPGLVREDLYKEISYKYSSPSVFRNPNFFIRNLHKVFSYIFEFALLCKLRGNKKLDIAFLYLPTDSFASLLKYKIFSLLLHFPIVLNRVESFSSFPNRNKKFQRINDKLFEKFSTQIADAIIPISDFIENQALLTSSGKPILKIPVLYDFKQPRSTGNSTSRNFVYCGAAGYFEVIEFIIKAFEELNDETHNLIFICNGTKAQLENIRTAINKSPQKTCIRHYSDLDYEDLMRHYMDATALLIPLRKTTQDKARFPQKIAEYTATGNPIVSTRWGEVETYFEDGVNAFLTNDYDVLQYAEKLKFIAQNPETAKQVGIRGRQTGMQYFHYENYSEALLQLIDKIKRN